MKQYMIYLNTEESVLVDAKEWVIRGNNTSSFRLVFLGEEESE